MEGSDFNFVILNETYLPILSAGAEKLGKKQHTLHAGAWQKKRRQRE